MLALFYFVSDYELFKLTFWLSRSECPAIDLSFTTLQTPARFSIVGIRSYARSDGGTATNVWLAKDLEKRVSPHF